MINYYLTAHAEERLIQRSVKKEELDHHRCHYGINGGKGEMRITFDRSADASYIKLSQKEIAKTVTVSDCCNVDLDAEGKVVGIELLFISQYMDDFKLWLELPSAAEYLNKSEITLRRWVKDGSVPYYRLGREYLFIKEELDEFIRKHKKA